MCFVSNWIRQYGQKTNAIRLTHGSKVQLESSTREILVLGKKGFIPYNVITNMGSSEECIRYFL